VEVGNRFVNRGALDGCVNLTATRVYIVEFNKELQRNVARGSCVSSQINDKKKLTLRSSLAFPALMDRPHSFPRDTKIYTRHRTSTLYRHTHCLAPSFLTASLTIILDAGESRHTEY
jgi:hypothetical protein